MGRHWGRQIAVAMTERDERAFLAFVRSTAPVRLLVSPARTQADLFLESFPPRRTKRKQFFIWNERFPWVPDRAPTTAGTFYVRDIGRAPVLEYGRDPLKLYNPHSLGHLYWSKGLTPGGAYDFEGYPFAYDAEKFGEWYELIVAWVKDHSRQKKRHGHSQYYLPNAWLWHGWYSR